VHSTERCRRRRGSGPVEPGRARPLEWARRRTAHARAPGSAPPGAVGAPLALPRSVFTSSSVRRRQGLRSLPQLAAATLHVDVSLDTAVLHELSARPHQPWPMGWRASSSSRVACGCREELLISDSACSACSFGWWLMAGASLF
jgi:hypothetical protein